MSEKGNRGRPVGKVSREIYGNMERQALMVGDIDSLDAFIRVAEHNLRIDLSDNDPQHLLIEAMKQLRCRMAEESCSPDDLPAMGAYIEELTTALELDLRDDDLKREAIAGLYAIRGHLQIETDRLKLRNRILENRGQRTAARRQAVAV